MDTCILFAYLAVRGRDMRMLSTLEPGVARPNFTPLSYTKLNSTYLKHRYTLTLRRIYKRFEDCAKCNNRIRGH